MTDMGITIVLVLTVTVGLTIGLKTIIMKIFDMWADPLVKNFFNDYEDTHE